CIFRAFTFINNSRNPFLGVLRLNILPDLENVTGLFLDEYRLGIFSISIDNEKIISIIFVFSNRSIAKSCSRRWLSLYLGQIRIMETIVNVIVIPKIIAI